MSPLARRRFSPALCAVLLTAPVLAALVAGPGSALPPPLPVPAAYASLSSPYNETNDLQVAYGPTGDGVAVWAESNGSTYTVWSARENSSSGWGAATFHQAASYYQGWLRAGVDAAQTASLVWVTNGDPNALWYARSFANGSSSAPVLLRTSDTAIVAAQSVMAVSPTGTMFVFWSEAGGASTSWAAVVDANGTVHGPTRMDGGSTAVFEKVLAPDPAGGGASAMACDRSGAVANLTESRYTPGSGWTAPVVVAPNLSNGCSYMDGGVDGEGSISVVAYASLNNTLLLIRKPAGAPWAAPQPFFTAGANDRVDFVKVSVPAGGTPLAAWRTTDGGITALYNSYASSFDPDAGWSPPVRLATNVSTRTNLALASTANGSGLALFSPPLNSTFTLSVAQFTRMVGCGGWSTPVDAGVGSSNYNYLAAGLRASGLGSIVYQLYNGAYWEVRAAPVELNLPGPLKVTAPVNGSSTADSLVAFQGTVQPGSTVTVPGATTVTLGDGLFSLLVPLHAGANRVEVAASFPAPWLGCSDKVTVEVEYNDPLPQLLLDFTQARADLNATSAALAEALAKLDAAVGDVTALQSALNDSVAEVVAAQAKLDSTSEELARVKVQFPWLEANVTAARADLTASQVKVSEAQARIILLEDQQKASAELLNKSAANNAALASQVALLSVVASVALLAAIAGMAMIVVKTRTPSGGVTRVKDPEPSKGGADAERTEPAKDREPERVSDKDR